MRHGPRGVLRSRRFAIRFWDGSELPATAATGKSLMILVNDPAALAHIAREPNVGGLARTLRRWIANLEANRREASRIAGSERERIWQLYLTGSARAFEKGRLSVYQVLSTRAGGSHRLPLVRGDATIPRRSGSDGQMAAHLAAGAGGRRQRSALELPSTAGADRRRQSSELDLSMLVALWIGDEARP